MVMLLLIAILLYVVVDEENVEKSIEEKLERWDKAK